MAAAAVEAVFAKDGSGASGAEGDFAGDAAGGAGGGVHDGVSGPSVFTVSSVKAWFAVFTVTFHRILLICAGNPFGYAISMKFIRVGRLCLLGNWEVLLEYSCELFTNA